MLNMGGGSKLSNVGGGFKKSLNQTQDNHNPTRMSITPEEVAALYANSSNAT